jgi:hypothetical protein
MWDEHSSHIQNDAGGKWKLSIDEIGNNGNDPSVPSCRIRKSQSSVLTDDFGRFSLLFVQI